MNLIKRAIALTMSMSFFAIALGIGAQPASADGGGPTSAYSSPAEEARAAQKQAMLNAFQRSDAVLVDYGEVIMALWQAPQAPGAALWCGPGSTQAIVGQWRGNAMIDNYAGPEGNGPDAYMARLANTLGEFNGVETTWDNYTRVTNQETLSTFYVSAVLTGGFNDYIGKLEYDIQAMHHPLAPVVQANGLPGWGYNVAHFLTVKQYWVAGDTTTIGDTAGFSQGRTLNAGWYTMSLSDFYYGHILTMYNKIVW